MSKVEEYNTYRSKMNEKLLSSSNLDIKRFFNLDSSVYKAGALDVKTKELLGLVASMVLRCDDCIKYHVQRCYEEKITKDELMEAFSIALLVGGSITIPHTRRALEFWEELAE
jgi:AhpD family alkylhydroperoxidase